MSGHKVTNPLINSVPPPMSSAPTLMRPGILKPPSVLLGTEFGGPGSGGQGYRIISNAGEHGFQDVPHLHFHIVSGRFLGPMILKK